MESLPGLVVQASATQTDLEAITTNQERRNRWCPTQCWRGLMRLVPQRRQTIDRSLQACTPRPADKSDWARSRVALVCFWEPLRPQPDRHASCYESACLACRKTPPCSMSRCPGFYKGVRECGEWGYSTLSPAYGSPSARRNVPCALLLDPTRAGGFP